MIDPVEALTLSQHDRVFRMYKSLADRALTLYKSKQEDGVPDATASSQPDPDGAGDDVGKLVGKFSMPPKKDETKVPPQAATPKPGAKPQPAAGPAKPVDGSGIAAAGATAQDEPEDEHDAIEDLANEADEADEAEGDVEEGAQAKPGTEGEADPLEALDEEAEELPADDGENHGVGDLNADGSVDSLIEEVTSLERDYYAAKGLHGDGSAKAGVVLDRFHRAVRKLVRAVMGGAGANAGEQPPSDGAPPKAGGGAKPPSAGAKPGAKPTDTGSDGKAPAGDDEDPVAALAGDDGAPKPSKPPVVPAAPKQVEGDKQGSPDPVDPKLKKSYELPPLKKGLAQFVTYNDDAPINDKYLPDYFGAFVEQALEEERRESAHAWVVMEPIDWANCIMHQFVMRLPRNANLRRIGEKFDVSPAMIAAILVARKLVKPNGDTVGLDAGNGYAGGGNGYGSVGPEMSFDYAKSFGAAANPDVLTRRSGLALPARDIADLAPPEAHDPFDGLRKSARRMAAAHVVPVSDAEMRPTLSESERAELGNLLALAPLLGRYGKLGG